MELTLIEKILLAGLSALLMGLLVYWAKTANDPNALDDLGL